MFSLLFDKSVYAYISKCYIKGATEALKSCGYEKEKLSKEEIVAIKRVWDALKVPYSCKWFVFFKKYTGGFSPFYVPHEIFSGVIERALNPILYANCMRHKGILDKFIDKKYLPYIIVNRMAGNIYDNHGNLISNNEAYQLLSVENEIVVKHSIDSGGGNGVRFISLVNKSVHEKEVLLNGILNENNLDLVIQRVIKQHWDFARFNDTSVNTVRLISLNLNGRISILSSCLRMGAKGSRVDNFNAGGFLIGIKPEGQLYSYAINGDYKKFLNAPQGVKFDQCQLRYYSLIKEKAVEWHSKMPFVKLISWDFTVDTDENIKVIEINLDSQQIKSHQIYNGPFFGDRTEEVIEYVKNHPARRFIYG